MKKKLAGYDVAQVKKLNALAVKNEHVNKRSTELFTVYTRR
jgi:hypothetical protein